ncbi:ABC transporter permease [Deinococcus yavapaiensis]|uniref:ABC-type spermidine/putrescine transport system permease subunit II n=1 Tax=Deinococcus yavapaiensis KR-236 TaxID=694435 RepID=A0A318SNU5_9DEIO|nr:ABC transporter permease [Deinococcus yavapaiensis]PYE56582.1 ABC-type spermidine/putrescine transport system permease subunit II [Deinococcus yavapaiensis KR-236]
MKPTRSPLWLSTLSWAAFVFLYVPILVLIVFSFNESKFGATWTGFTTKWYGVLFAREDVGNALENSMIVAVVSTLISTVLGTLVGLGLWRYDFRFKRAFTFLLVVPIVIPDVVMAVGLLMFYGLVRDVIGVLDLGLPTVILAHVTFQISYVALVVRSRLAGYDKSLEEAARDLGANGLKAFGYVMLPLIVPGILAGALLAFTLSLDDFVVTFFTSGPGATTLPVLVYSSVKRGVTPDINALSSLLIFVTVVAIVAGNALLRRRS